MLKLLFLILNAGKFVKALLLAGAMLAALWYYAQYFGWSFAVGVLALIFIHELGHVLAARRLGLQAGFPVLLPGIAWTRIEYVQRNVQTEAYVAVGGPVVGSAAAMVAFWIGEWQQLPLFTVLAYVGFLINLLNLLPAPFLDGGRIVAIVSPKLWLLGLPLLVGLYLWNHSPMILIIALFSLPGFFQAWRLMRGHPDAVPEHLPANYYDSPLELRVKYGAFYLGLTAFLGVMSFELYQGLAAALPHR